MYTLSVYYHSPPLPQFVSPWTQLPWSPPPSYTNPGLLATYHPGISLLDLLIQVGLLPDPWLGSLFNLLLHCSTSLINFLRKYARNTRHKCLKSLSLVLICDLRICFKIELLGLKLFFLIILKAFLQYFLASDVTDNVWYQSLIFAFLKKKIFSFPSFLPSSFWKLSVVSLYFWHLEI